MNNNKQFFLVCAIVLVTIAVLWSRPQTPIRPVYLENTPTTTSATSIDFVFHSIITRCIDAFKKDYRRESENVVINEDYGYGVYWPAIEHGDYCALKTYTLIKGTQTEHTYTKDKPDFTSLKHYEFYLK